MEWESWLILQKFPQLLQEGLKSKLVYLFLHFIYSRYNKPLKSRKSIFHF